MKTRKALSFLFTFLLMLVACSNGKDSDKTKPSGDNEPGEQEPGEGGQDIPGHVHTFVDHAAVEANCQHGGNIAYAECSECHKIFDSTHTNEITDGSHIIGILPHNMTHHECVPFEHIEYWTCSMCHKNFADEKGTEEVTVLTDYDVHNLYGDNVKNYLEATTEAAQVEALGYGSPFNDQIQKTLTWRADGSSRYMVELATNQQFDDAKTYTVKTNKCTLPGTLLPGTRYYWRVMNSKGDYIVGIRGFETPGGSPFRPLKVDGLFNVRDAGGWTGRNGNQVLYGKIIRGGYLKNITAAGKDVFVNELGIKTELDLRANGSPEMSDSRINYYRYGLNQYTMLVPNYTSPNLDGLSYGYGFDTSTGPALKNIFEKLADPDNYPVYFHCNAGADRTGSLSYLINGLLGVSYEDLLKDYELTTFSSQGNRFRSGISNGEFVKSGDHAGIMQCNSDNYVAFGKLHELISTRYAREDGLLSSAIEYYLKKVCSIEDETIKAVRRNLLGKDVDFPEIVVEVDKTFTMENGNITLNSQLVYEEGTFFGKEDVIKIYRKQYSGGDEDHYVYFNTAMIKDPKYKKFHFEIYVPDSSTKWNITSGCRFHFSIKTTSTNNMQFGDNVTTTVENTNYHLDVDAWNTYELDISSYTNETTLQRFALYLPYGTNDNIPVVYLTNTYVIE